MYTINAIFDGSSFKPLQPIPIKESYEVTITFKKPIKAKVKKTDLSVDGVVYKDIGEKRRASFGCMKDKIWMADDFDAPLEDMREYME